MSRGPAPPGSELGDYVTPNPKRKNTGTKRKPAPHPNTKGISQSQWIAGIQGDPRLTQDQKDTIVSQALNITLADAHNKLVSAKVKRPVTAPAPGAPTRKKPPVAGAPPAAATPTPSSSSTASPTSGGVTWNQGAGANSPNLAGVPGAKEYTAELGVGAGRRVQQYPTGDVAASALYKLRTGGDLSQFEIQALEQSGQGGFAQGESASQASGNAWRNTGVYTGEMEPVPVPKGENAERIAGKSKPGQTRPKMPQTVDQLEHALYGMPTDQVKALQQKLLDAGYGSGFKASGLVDGNTIKAYDELLKETAAYQNEPNSQLKQITPQQLLDRKLAGIKAAQNSGTRHTETTSSITLTDPVTAKGYLLGSMKSLLGRMPTTSEINQFITTLNNFEQANPTTTTTTSNTTGTDSNSSTSNSSFTQGGPPAGDAFAQSYLLQNNKQEVNTNRAIGFYQAALDALKAPVPVPQ